MMYAATHMKGIIRLGVLVLALVPVSGGLRAESPGDSAQAYTSAELRELVGPVALYPDDLLAIVLPASTYPVQVVQAARYLDEHEQNQTLTPGESWDDSIVALLNYPEVVDLLNSDLDWTWRLGDAVLNQQSDVIRAIQQFRDSAYTAGNLTSDDRQVVRYVDDAIEIRPVEKEIIYVPYYQPERVIVYQSAPAYYYYPSPYPVYYYPYPATYSFQSGYFWGITTAFIVGWDTHRLRLHRHHYRSHPYYGHRYRNHFTVRRHRDLRRQAWRSNRDHIASESHWRGESWRPGRRYGARPVKDSTAKRRHRSTTVSRNLQARQSTEDRVSTRLAMRGSPGNQERSNLRNKPSLHNKSDNHSNKASVAPKRSRMASTARVRDHKPARHRQGTTRIRHRLL